jgi:hypothetical protein
MKLFRQIYRALLPLVVPGVFAAGCAVPEPATAEVPPPPIDLVWSPSGKQAVFAAVPDGSPGPDCPTELFELDLEAVTLLRLLQAQAGALDPETDLSCFYDPKYSADGLQIYFITPAWATSGAIQAYDRTTGKVAFITDGGPYLVIGSGPHKGMLLVVRRKYPDNLDDGAYEEIDLVDPLSGKVVSGSPTMAKILRETHGLGEVQNTIKALAGWQSW